MTERTVRARRGPREAAGTILIHPVLLIIILLLLLFFAQPKYLPHRPFSTVSAGLRQPRFSQFSKSCILTTWVTSVCRTLTVTVVTPPPNITDPVVNAQGGERLGDGFVKGLLRHVERVLCFVQVVDDDGTSLEPHEGNLSYSPFVRQ